MISTVDEDTVAKKTSWKSLSLDVSIDEVSFQMISLSQCGKYTREGSGVGRKLS